MIKLKIQKIIAILLVFACVMPVVTEAATPKDATKNVVLTFSGTTASCYASVRADSTTDKIVVTLTLSQGGSTVASWTESGTGVLTMRKSQAVTSGKTYTLTMSVTINGKSVSGKTTTKTCS